MAKRPLTPAEARQLLEAKRNKGLDKKLEVPKIPDTKKPEPKKPEVVPEVKKPEAVADKELPTQKIRELLIKRMTAHRVSRLTQVNAAQPVLLSLCEDIDFESTIAALCNAVFKPREAHIVYAADIMLGQLATTVCLVQHRSNMDGRAFVPVVTQLRAEQVSELLTLKGPLLIVVDDMYDVAFAALRHGVLQHLHLKQIDFKTLEMTQTLASMFGHPELRYASWFAALVSTSSSVLFIESQMAVNLVLLEGKAFARVTGAGDKRRDRPTILASAFIDPQAVTCQEELHHLMFDVHGVYPHLLPPTDAWFTHAGNMLEALMAADTLCERMADVMPGATLPETFDIVQPHAFLPQPHDKQFALGAMCVSHLQQNIGNSTKQCHHPPKFDMLLSSDKWRQPEYKYLQMQLIRQCPLWCFLPSKK